MSVLIDIADAVVAELNGASFAEPFTAERRALPGRELKDLATLRVTVVPKAVEINGASRSASAHDYQVDIGVQKKLGSDLEAETAEMLDLVESIADHLRRRNLPMAVWVRTVNEPVYAPEHLAEQRTFTSVLTVTYRVLR